MGELRGASKVMQTPCGDIEYAETGKGPAVLILHGSPGGYDQGLAFGSELATRGFRVIAVSRSGYLRTPLGTGATFAEQADAVDSLLGNLGIADCNVLGISEGAPCALELAARHPQRVSRIALISPVLPAPERSFHETLARGILRKFGDDFGSFCFDGILKAFPAGAVADLIGIGSSLSHEQCLAAARQAQEDLIGQTFLSSLIRSATPISEREAGIMNDNSQIMGSAPLVPSSVMQPLLVLCGEADTHNVTPGAREHLSKFPGVRFLTVRGAGAVLPVGNEYNRTWDAIADFFRTASAPAPVTAVDATPAAESPIPTPPLDPAAAPSASPEPSPTVADTKGTRPPNFVIILMDDMGYGDIEPFGSKLNRTPNLNRMAAEGMKLTSFYCAPVCTPSRAQLMTGCYAKRVGLGPLALPPTSHYGINPKELTIADLLKRRGYSTMILGKWHLGDQPEFFPTRHGFDRYIGSPTSPNPLMHDEKVVEENYNEDLLTHLYTDEAVKFLKENREKPFFLYLAHIAVHVPLHPGPGFKGHSRNGKYGDWVEESDWSVGRVLDALKELKLDTNTLVLFMSDNGPWLVYKDQAGTAGPLRGGKFTTWEGGVREPAIAWWPGKIAPGSVSGVPLSEIDVLPTLVQLAGVEMPRDRIIDGRDIWPVLSGSRDESPHDCIYYWGMTGLEAVRSGPWKLVIATQDEGTSRHPADQEKVFATREAPRLYNLVDDIGETKNVAAEHPDVVARLQEFISKMDKDLTIRIKGPNVRDPGYVKDPKPLHKRIGDEYD